MSRAESPEPEPETHFVRRRSAALLGLVVTLVALVVSCGLWLGSEKFIIASSGRGLMAPATALALMVLGGLLAVWQWWGDRAVVRRIVGGAALALTLPLVLLVLGPGKTPGVLLAGESSLVTAAERAAGLSSIHITYLSAASLAALALALAMATLRPGARGIQTAPLAIACLVAVVQVGAAMVDVSGVLMLVLRNGVLSMPLSSLCIAVLALALAIGCGLVPLLLHGSRGESDAQAGLAEGPLRLRRLLFLLGLAAPFVVLAVGGEMYLRLHTQEQLHLVGAEFTSVASLRAWQIAQWRRERLGDAAALRELPLFRRLARLKPTEEDLGDLRAYLAAFREVYGYRQIAILDARARAFACATAPGVELAPPPAEQLAEVRRNNRIDFGEIHRGADGALVLDILAPLVGPAGADPGHVALLQVDVGQQIQALLSRWELHETQGRCYLVRMEGSGLRVLGDHRESIDRRYQFQLLPQPDNPVIGRFMRSESLTKVHDEEGRALLGLARPVPDSPWHLVLQMDAAVAYGHIKTETLQVVVIILVLGLACAVAAAMIWRQRQRALMAGHHAALERLGMLMENISDVVLVFDEAGRIVDANARVAQVYGRTPEEMVRLTITELRAPAAAQGAAADFARAKLPGGVLFETVHRRKDGTEFPVEVNSRPIIREGREHVLSVIRDITERRRQASEVAQREARLEFIFNCMPVGLSFRDATGHLNVNPEHERITGVPAAESNRPGVFAEATHPEDRARQQAAQARFLAGEEQAFSLEKRYIHRDGREVWVQLTSRWFNAASFDGQREALTTIVDITERKLREGQIERMNRMYLLTSELNKILVHVRDRQQLFDDVVNSLTSVGRFTLAWVGWHDPETQRISVDAVSGIALDNVRQLKVSSRGDEPSGRGPTGTAFRQNRAVICNDFLTDPMTRPWHEEAERQGVRASMCVPLRLEGNPVAVLSVYAGEAGFFGRDEVALLEEAASEMAFALAVLANEDKRRKAEEALRVHESRLETLLTANPAVIYSLRAVGDFRTNYLTPNIREMLGYEAAQFIASNDFWTSHVHPDDLAYANAMASDLRSEGRVVREYRFRHKDGTWRWIHDEMRGVVDDQGRQVELVGFMLDVTDRRHAEDALQAREKVFSSMIGQAVDAIALVDAATGEFVEFNSSAYSGLGYTREEFSRLNFNTVQASEGATLAAELYFKLTLSGGATFETLLRHRDGGTHIVRLSARAVGFHGRDYLAVVWSDITAQKSLENIREEERKFLSSLIENSGSQVFVKDPEGRYLLVNGRWSEICGFSRENTLGRTDADLFSAEDAARFRAVDEEVMRSRQTRTLEETLSQPGQRTRYFLSVKFPTYSAAGEVTGICGMATEITDQRQLAEDLRASEERYRLIAENSTDVIWLLDLASQRITYVSPGCRRALGYTPEEIMTHGWADLMLPESLERVQRLLEARVAAIASGEKQGEHQTNEFSYRHRDGRVVQMEVVTAVLLDAAGAPRQVLGASRDVTERKRLEKLAAEKEQQFRFIFESAPVGIAFATQRDGNGGLMVNSEHARITGVPAADSQREGVFARATFPGDYERQMEAAAPFVRGEVDSYYFDKRYLHPDGTVVWARLTSRWLPHPVTGEKLAVTILVDVTEQKHAEVELRYREELFSSIFNQAFDSVVLFDLATGNFSEFNEAAHRNLGYTREEFESLTIADLDVGLSPEQIREALGLMCQPGGHIVQTKHRRKDGEVRDVRLGAKKISLRGRDYLATVWTDITESNRLFEALRDSEERHRTLFESMETGIVYQDPAGKITAANPAAARILGLNLDQLLGKTSLDPDWRAVHEDGREFAGNEHPAMVAVQSGARVRNVLMGVSSGAIKGRRWIEIDAVPETHPGADKPFRVFTTFRDITARLEAEQSLRRLSVVVEQSPVVVVMTDTSGRITYVNPRFEEVTGYTAAEALGQNPRILKSGGTPAEYYDELWRTITAGKVWRGEFVNRRKDGTVFTELAIITPVRDTQGRITNFVALKEDITERKRTEESLRRSQELLEATGQVAAIGGWEVDVRTQEVFFSAQTRRLHEVADDYQPTIEGAIDFHLPKFRPQLRSLFDQSISQGTPWQLETQMVTGRGRTRWVQIRGEAVREDGKVVRIRGSFQDITERREAFQQLRKMSRIIEQAPLSVAITDLEGNIEYVNPQFCLVSGYNREEIIGQNPRILKSGLTLEQTYQAMWETISAGHIWHGELHNRRKNGELFIENTVIAPVTDDDGRTTHFVALKEDITERKRTEVALREAQERYKLIAENTDDVIWLYDLRLDCYVYASPSSMKLRGLRPEEYIGKKLTDMIPPAEAERFGKLLPRVVEAFNQGDMSVRTLTHEMQQIRKDGRPIFTEVVTTLIPDFQGRAIQILGVTRDITQRRQAGEALRRSEELYRLIAENTTDAIWLFDLGKRQFTYMSPGCQGIIGYSPEEMVGRSFEGLLSEESLRDAMGSIAQRIAAYRAGDDAAQHKIAIYQQVHKDGHHFPVEVVTTLLIDSDGEVRRLLGVTRDVSDRERAERDLRRSRDRLSRAEHIAKLGNWEYDLRTGQAVCSEEVYRILETSSTGKPFSSEELLARIHPDDRTRVEEIAARGVAEMARFSYSCRLLLPSGSIRHVEITSEPVTDEGTQAHYYIGTIQDVTDKRQAELALHDLVRELRAYQAVALAVENRDRSVDELLAAVAGHIPGALRWPDHAQVEIRFGRRHVRTGAPGRRVVEKTVPLMVNLRKAGSIIYGLVARSSHTQSPLPVEERSLPDSEIMAGIARTLGLGLSERESLEQLRQSEERFRGIFDQAEVGMFETTPRGEIMRGNPHLAGLLGLTPEQFQGRHWSEFLGAALQPAKPPPAEPVEVRCTSSQGREFWAMFTSKRELDDTGKPLAHICLLQDISAQVAARETLQRFNAELEQQVAERTRELAARNREVQALLESVPDMVLRLRRDGSVLHCQPAQSGTPLQGFVTAEGKPCVPESLHAAALSAGIRALEQDATVASELELALETGPASLELRAAPAGTDDFVVFVRDITARKRLEAETNATLEREREVSEMKTRFISVASHEFRTPMSAALGSVELLYRHYDKLLATKREELFQRIFTSMARMTDMLDDVLTLSRIDTKQVRQRPVSLNLETFIQHVIEESTLADQDGHRFEFTHEGDGRDFVTDNNLAHHIVSNLLSNACRYSEVGTLVRTHLAVDAVAAQITIRDEGLGIPEPDLARIFEPFERGSNVGTIKGTGLGLNIARRMTEMLGGTIMVESTLGQGSTFTIVIPRQSLTPPAS